MYKIDVCWYADDMQLESGQFTKVVDSGFSGLSLEEAYMCKSKMSESGFGGLKRYNMVVEDKRADV